MNKNLNEPLQTVVSKTSFRDDRYLPHRRLKSQSGKFRLPNVETRKSKQIKINNKDIKQTILSARQPETYIPEHVEIKRNIRTRS